MTSPIHFLIASLISLALFAALMWYYLNSKRVIDEMWTVDTYEAAELIQLCKGDFNAIIEVQGAVSCDKPVIAPVTKLPCCWYHTKIMREEGSGNNATWVTEMDETRFAIFKIEDKTGSTLVDPTNADMDTTTIYNSITYGNKSLLEKILANDADRYHVTEEIFSANGYAYVLGQASDVGGRVLVHYPGTGYLDPKRKFFIISRKTEKELTQEKHITVSICFWFSIVAFLSAVYFACVAAGVLPMHIIPISGF